MKPSAAVPDRHCHADARGAIDATSSRKDAELAVTGDARLVFDMLICDRGRRIDLRIHAAGT
jgi:hypothetical protein